MKKASKKAKSGQSRDPPPMNLATLVAKSRLLAIDLVKVRAERIHEQQHGAALVLPKEFGLKIEAEVGRPKQILVSGSAFLARLVCVWVDTQSDEHLARLQVEFRLAYAFEETKTPVSDKLAEEFGNRIVLHHAWPFLRERARTFSAAIGMPAYVLPLRHLVSKAP